MKNAKTERRHTAFRLPPDVLARLDEVSAKTSISKTKLVEVILREGLSSFKLPKFVVKDETQRDLSA